MSYGLTSRQLALLRFIRGYQLANDGVSPTLRECVAGLGGSGASTSNVLRMLVELEQRGAIRRLRQRNRAIEVLTAVPVPMIGTAPLFTVPGPWSRPS